MNTLEKTIEAILFVESQPVTMQKLAKAVQAKVDEVQQAIATLQAHHAERDAGVILVTEDNKVQLMTAPDISETVQDYLSVDDVAELTRPSLETLTIIAYRGPVAKTEIELIRGVNCSLILRNLRIRGLVEEVGETETGSPVYQVTIEFLRHIGVEKVADLPRYEELNQNVHLQELLEKQEEDFFAQSGQKK